MLLCIRDQYSYPAPKAAGQSSYLEKMGGMDDDGRGQSKVDMICIDCERVATRSLMRAKQKLQFQSHTVCHASILFHHN
jgi:hypothetical protein